MESFDVQGQQVALNDPSQNKEDDEPSYDVGIKAGLGGRLPDPFIHGKGDDHTDHKEEERHDDVVEMESEPLGMGKLFGQYLGRLGLDTLVEGIKEMIGQNDHQHIKAPQYVDGKQPIGDDFFLVGKGHGFRFVGLK